MLSCKNVGTVDRAVRFVVGIGALAAAFTALDAQAGAPAGIIAAVVGVVMLLTAALRMCPLYIPIKLSTCKSEQ